MARSATSRLKVNAPLGRMPVLQFMGPCELQIDAAYQRSIESGESKTLIRKIAQHWNWDLCQPLVVARRPDGGLFVIDGQHRLEAAKLRRDIAQLPCVVVDYSSAADEAASFVHLNQQRRPLGALDLFKAALASDDPEATAIAAAMEAAGLSLAAHSNFTAWKPGQVAIIGGIQRQWRREGAAVTGEALQVLATAFAGEILRYAGTVWPGTVTSPQTSIGTPARRWIAGLLLPIATFTLTGCGSGPKEFRAAIPEPQPEVTAPEILKEPVKRPSWMDPVLAAALERAGMAWWS